MRRPETWPWVALFVVPSSLHISPYESQPNTSFALSNLLHPDSRNRLVVMSQTDFHFESFEFFSKKVQICS